MKATPIFAVLLASLLTACDPQGATHPTPAYAAPYGASEPRDIRPKVGMTKAEVTAAYGKPDNVLYSSKGELWRYWFNRGTAFFTGRVRAGLFQFGPDGRLADFVFNE